MSSRRCAAELELSKVFRRLYQRGVYDRGKGPKKIGREDSWEEQRGQATEERTEEHGRRVV